MSVSVHAPGTYRKMLDPMLTKMLKTFFVIRPLAVELDGFHPSKKCLWTTDDFHPSSSTSVMKTSFKIFKVKAEI
jgi:hypothetical protein